MIRNGKYLKTATEKALNALEDKYYADVYKLAAKVREKYVVPYCKAKGYTFVAGMGGWAFYDKNDDVVESLPVRITHNLGLYVSTANDLGSLMNDYTKE